MTKWWAECECGADLVSDSTGWYWKRRRCPRHDVVTVRWMPREEIEEEWPAQAPLFDERMEYGVITDVSTSGVGCPHKAVSDSEAVELLMQAERRSRWKSWQEVLEWLKREHNVTLVRS